MNAKFALALILTLHVSMNFCEGEEPPQELLDKYEGMKQRFLRRIDLGIERLVKYLDSYDQAPAVRERLEALPTHPKVVALRNMAGAVRTEVEPLMDDLRRVVLGFYSQHLRPYIGQHLDTGIQQMSSYLDQVAPAE